jgi:hypothetical protein
MPPGHGRSRAHMATAFPKNGRVTSYVTTHKIGIMGYNYDYNYDYNYITYDDMINYSGRFIIQRFAMGK